MARMPCDHVRPETFEPTTKASTFSIGSCSTVAPSRAGVGAKRVNILSSTRASPLSATLPFRRDTQRDVDRHRPDGRRVEVSGIPCVRRVKTQIPMLNRSR